MASWVGWGGHTCWGALLLGPRRSPVDERRARYMAEKEAQLILAVSPRDFARRMRVVDAACPFLGRLTPAVHADLIEALVLARAGDAVSSFALIRGTGSDAAFVEALWRIGANFQLCPLCYPELVDDPDGPPFGIEVCADCLARMVPMPFAAA